METKAILFVLLGLLGLAACSPAARDEGGVETPVLATETPTGQPAERPTDMPADLTEAMLQNMSFRGIYAEPVTLIDGHYEGAPFVEGGASRPTVMLLPFTAFGDLNGDGVGDAIVLLLESAGGSGSFVYLAVVINQDGAPDNTATLLLGDRVSPASLTIETGHVVLEAATHAENDPLCCPSLKTRTTYAYEDGGLTIVSTEDLAAADVDKAAGANRVRAGRLTSGMATNA